MSKIQIGQEIKENVSKAGKPYKVFKAKDEQGVIHTDVVAFSFYSKFNDIKSGAILEGLIKEDEYQGRKSIKLVDGNLGPKPSGFGGGMGKVLLAEKNKNIEKSQDRKEESIMISSTARMAHETALAFKDDEMSDVEFKTSFLEWRKWYIQNWEPSNPDLTSTGDKVPDFKEVDEINPSEIPF